MLQQRPFPIEVTMAPDRVDGLAPPLIYCIFLDEHGVNIQARSASTCLSPEIARSRQMPGQNETPGRRNGCVTVRCACWCDPADGGKLLLAFTGVDVPATCRLEFGQSGRRAARTCCPGAADRVLNGGTHP
jgi:hypothetical protein